MQGDKCPWLHEILKKQTLFKHPFDLSQLPQNAIYFFYEDGEKCQGSTSNQRIVRIGTAKQENFRSRIFEHYLFDEKKLIFDAYQPKPSDRSIFRKNIGRAILNRKGDEYLFIWDIDFTKIKNRNKYQYFRDMAKEQDIEKEISNILRTTFSFRYLILENEFQRIGPCGLENRLIGSVSNCSCCKPSSEWLGNYSPINKIRISGLWQTQHLWTEEINDVDVVEIEESIKMFL